jgi:RNA polymerase-binding transcription factor
MTGRTQTVRTAAPRSITQHLPELRSALEQQRQFRVEQLDQLAAEAAAPMSMADEARIHVAAAVKVAAMAALADIDAALDRLERGSYGTCEQCRTAIPLERLEILPMSRLCMRCQHAAETGRPATPESAAGAGVSTTRPRSSQITHQNDRRRTPRYRQTRPKASR